MSRTGKVFHKVKQSIFMVKLTLLLGLLNYAWGILLIRRRNGEQVLFLLSKLHFVAQVSHLLRNNQVGLFSLLSSSIF